MWSAKPATRAAAAGRSLPLLAAVGQRRALSVGRTAEAHIGFIGLGNMGEHMAKNLISAGHTLTVLDINEEANNKLAAAGAAVGKSNADCADGADFIVTMLPNSQHVKGVFTGDDGILSTIKAGAICIDSSTIDPGVSKEVAGMVAEKGAAFVDAPVSGGTMGALNGTLTFMVGGPDASFEGATPVLQGMGKNIVHCGDVGTGQIAKICNNMMLGISMIGASETMNLGKRLGIDEKVLTNILSTSTGRCWALDTCNPCPGVFEGVPSSNGYAGGFQSGLILKDLGLAQAAAESCGAQIPHGSLARQIYGEMSGNGYENKDFSSAYEYIQEVDCDSTFDKK